MIKKTIVILIFINFILITSNIFAEEIKLATIKTEEKKLLGDKTSKEKEKQEILESYEQYALDAYPIFDDRMHLQGYIQKYQDIPKEILVEMIKDDTLNPFKTAAAVRVFKEKFLREIVSKEKKQAEKFLLKRLSRSDSPFVHVEIMHTMCVLDRYKYFKSMVPALIQKLTHYNSAVNELAFTALNDLIKSGQNRSREARIVFSTMRKILFLTRKRLAEIEKPSEKLARQLSILRWSIKVLGNEELKRLPKQVIHLL